MPKLYVKSQTRPNVVCQTKGSRNKNNAQKS